MSSTSNIAEVLSNGQGLAEVTYPAGKKYPGIDEYPNVAQLI